eukprot:NODE_10_length_47437_cov_0.363429.p11 type:complete len:388 gc:universal NODE_10_length_47437_cov_0.363429:8898-10061(+)
MNAISGLLGAQPELLLAIDKPEYSEEQPALTQSQIIKGPSSKYFVYLKGKIVIRVKHGKSLQHNGIDIQFVNAIENDFDKSCNMILNSVGLSIDATNPLNEKNLPIIGGSVVPFEFALPITYESYMGKRVKVIYFVECTIKKTLNNTVAKEFVTISPNYFLKPIPPQRPIHLEVGIEDVLHLELSCKKNTFHLNDCIVGLLSFILVRIKIKTIELQILRKEGVGTFSTSNASEQQIITSLQVVDGSISKGDMVPIRLFLAALQLSPTFKEIEKRISVRYFLNLVLVDEENRRYFKQQEIDMYREIPGIANKQIEPSSAPLILSTPVTVESEQGVTLLHAQEEPQELKEGTITPPLEVQAQTTSSSSNTDNEENEDPLYAYPAANVWK